MKPAHVLASKPAHVLVMEDGFVQVFNANGARMPRLEGHRTEVREILIEAARGATIQRRVNGACEEIGVWQI